ncbi:hypothetical protein ABTD24_00895 [Acinetobacter baumannii]
MTHQKNSSAGSIKDFAWLFLALVTCFNPAQAFILAMLVYMVQIYSLMG